MFFQIVRRLLGRTPDQTPESGIQTRQQQHIFEGKTMESNIFGQLEQLISDGQTAAALELFAQTGHEDAPILQDQFDAAQALYLAGTMDAETWTRTKARLHYALLECCRQAEADNRAAPASLPDQIQDLIARGKLESALQLLVQNGYTPAAGLMTRLEQAAGQFDAGTIDFDAWMHIQNQIMVEVLKMLHPEQQPMPVERIPEKKITIIHVQDVAIRVQIRQCLDRQDLETAIALCKAHGEESVLLEARYNSMQKHAAMGLLTTKELDETRRNLQDDIREALDAVESTG